MKRWAIIGTLIMSLLLTGLVACTGTGAPPNRQAEVVRGDLTVGVNGNGKIEVTREKNLVFGSTGKVASVTVEDGDEVKKGDVLAKLETDALELSLSQAQVAEAQAQVIKTQAEVALAGAEANLELAKFNLDRMEDVDKAKDEITEAEWEIKVAEMRLKEANTTGDQATIAYWRTELLAAKLHLADAQKDLVDLLTDADYATLIVDEVQIKALQVKAAELVVEQSRKSVEQANRSIDQASRAVAYARKQLDEATITAPFDGLVASVNFKEGDILVSPAAKTIHLIDPSRLGLKVDIDEIDITRIKPGQEAIVSVDALETEFKGNVVSIAPLPNPQQDVVLYKVEVNFDVPQGSGLRIGMSATADIVIDKRTDVLLVPSRAVTEDSQGNPVVKVMVGKQTEERKVTVGLSDGFETEIISGLSEGEQVVIETSASP